jgi:cytochrome oxidase Cu insertion factor (SCO1/SenC/PrrC family)
MRFPQDRCNRVTSSAVFSFLWWVSVSQVFAAPVMGFLPPEAGSYRLERIQPASDGKVVDAQGVVRHLSEFTQHRVTLLAFMYASCADPDGCPYALTVMHQVKDSLKDLPATRGLVRFISLSFDPVRDTPATLALYGKGLNGESRHVDWEFLTTGSRADLLPILNDFGQDVGVNVDRATGKPTGTYSHVLKLFLIDKNSQVREIYTTAYLLPRVVLNDIKTLLLEDGVKLK